MFNRISEIVSIQLPSISPLDLTLNKFIRIVMNEITILDAFQFHRNESTTLPNEFRRLWPQKRVHLIRN